MFGKAFLSDTMHINEYKCEMLTKNLIFKKKTHESKNNLTEKWKKNSTIKTTTHQINPNRKNPKQSNDEKEIPTYIYMFICMHPDCYVCVHELHAARYIYSSRGEWESKKY